MQVSAGAEVDSTTWTLAVVWYQGISRVRKALLIFTAMASSARYLPGMFSLSGVVSIQPDALTVSSTCRIAVSADRESMMSCRFAAYRMGLWLTPSLIPSSEDSELSKLVPECIDL